MTCLRLLLTAQLSQHEMTALFAIWSTTGLVTWVCPPSAHPVHFNCSRLSNRCKSDPCVPTQRVISDSELALELSPEVLTSTLRVWWNLHTEGLHPYHIQRIQHLEPADMCSRLELSCWINSNPIWFVTFCSLFTRDGVNNTRNSHLWDHDKQLSTLLFLKRVVQCHWWHPHWFVHFPATSDRWYLCKLLARWTASTLRERLSTNNMIDVLPAWQSAASFQSRCQAVSES
jgi:hypothetical protein